MLVSDTLPQNAIFALKQKQIFKTTIWKNHYGIWFSSAIFNKKVENIYMYQNIHTEIANWIMEPKRWIVSKNMEENCIN